MSASSQVIPACTKGSKFVIGEKFYVFNIGMQNPLIAELIVKGIVNDETGLMYTHDKNMWIKEEYLFKNRKDAYKALISHAEAEMLDQDIK